MSSLPALPRRLRRTATGLLALACVTVSLSFAAPAESAPAVNHDRVVSAVPSNTPAVNDGEVDAIVQVGNTMIVGGTFTSVTPVGGARTTRNRIMAFNASTGALVSTFVPNLNNYVNVLIPGPTADSVYVGGAFTTLNGVSTSHVALLNTATGAVVGGFKAAATNGVVNSMAKRGNRLILGGNFTTAGGVAHAGLASLNATTGALDGWMNAQVSGHHNDTGSGAQGAVGVRDLDVNADGSRLVAIGNFKRVNGTLRDQIVMMSLSDAASGITADWATTRYSPYCFNFAFDTYVRGVSFSPDGSYLVVTATGGYVANTLCDTAARFETSATGSDVQPTWVNYTGGDTLWANTITEKAVYVGGHQRWLNNSLASDRAGAGSVPRPGLGALSTTTGMPLAWNPGRNPRGAAVYALYATPTGLWLGSDTEYIGNHKYKRPRLAFFPLASGSPEASDATAALPGTAYLGADQSPPSTTTNDLRTVAVTSTGAGAETSVSNAGVDWTGVRGSFVAGGKLWYGKSNATFNSRTFSNGAFGPEVKVDPYNDPVWAGVDTGSRNTYDGKPPDIYAQMSTVTGMAYAGGRLYYVRNNDANLYWRWFNADSGIIGSAQFTANGGRNWSGTLGMFATGGKLYFVSSATGNLNSITLTSTGPSGSSAVVNGPATGGTDWRARALFLTGASQPPPNAAPTASFTRSCAGLACTFNGVDSRDTDGTITNYAWNFGDGTSGSGSASSISHTYTTSGTYPVTLVVTDDDGAASIPASASVTVPVTSSITFIGSVTRSANVAAPSLTIPATVVAGDTLLLTSSLGNATSAEAPAGWTQVGDQSATSSLRSKVWVRTATPSDANSSVAVTLDTIHKATLALSVYRGANATTPVVSATASTDASTSSHTTPAVTAPSGAWVISAWAEKGTNTLWTLPGSVQRRAAAYSTGSGSVSTAVADSGGPQTGAVPGTVATTSATSVRGVNWSIVLAPQ